MVSHEDAIEILREIGMEWEYEVNKTGETRPIHSKTKKRGMNYSYIDYEPDVVWEDTKERAVFEVEFSYDDPRKVQKLLFGTIALAFLYAKHETKLTWFYIVVDGEEFKKQVFRFLHCINDHFGKTFGLKWEDFQHQIILASSEMNEIELKKHFKKQLRGAWQC